MHFNNHWIWYKFLECRTNLFLYFIFIIIHIYTYIKSFILYIIIINSCFTWNIITLVTSNRFRKRIWFSGWSLRMLRRTMKQENVRKSNPCSPSKVHLSRWIDHLVSLWSMKGKSANLFCCITYPALIYLCENIYEICTIIS